MNLKTHFWWINFTFKLRIRLKKFGIRLQIFWIKFTFLIGLPMFLLLSLATMLYVLFTKGLSGWNDMTINPEYYYNSFKDHVLPMSAILYLFIIIMLLNKMLIN